MATKKQISKSQRENLYKWARRLKGKGQLSKIGKKMSALKNTRGKGSKTAILQLSKISAEKKVFLQGLAKGRSSR